MYCTPAEVRRRATQMTTEEVADDEVLALIEQASRYFDLVCGVEPETFEPAYYPVWESAHAYVVGDIVTPTTRNSHIYRVTTAGISGSTEPSFPTSSGGTVTNGNVVFTEHGADVVASERTFYGDNTNFLRLDPFVPGTIDATITLPDGYTVPEFTEVSNYLARSSAGILLSGRPWLNDGGWIMGVPVTVTAVWGYPETPADVKMAVIELVINLWRETDPAFLRLTDLEHGPLRETLPPRVSAIAKRYRMKQAIAAFI